jgi:hypothetical protein
VLHPVAVGVLEPVAVAVAISVVVTSAVAEGDGTFVDVEVGAASNVGNDQVGECVGGATVVGVPVDVRVGVADGATETVGVAG